MIVGDFDTAPCPQQEDDEIVVLPHVKDDTDTEYAAKLAVQKGFDEVLLLGGLGGRRLEHTLANLCTGLGLEKRGVRATLQDERSRITFVMPGETRRYPKEDYFYFSAFPMEGRAEGVCEQGSYYELTDAELTAGYPLGVSNEYAEGSDCITVSSLEANRAGFIPKENLEHAFPEFGPYLGQCQFTGCSHRTEKGCAVRQALAEGKLSQTRYDSYCAMYDEVKDVKDWQRPKF